MTDFVDDKPEVLPEVSLEQPPHIPSWTDADSREEARREYRAQLGYEDSPTVPVDCDPQDDSWLDVVRKPTTEDLDLGPKSIGEMMEILGSLPHFNVRFDSSKLAAVDVSEFASAELTISKEKQEENLRRMLDVFSKLPELEFEHGNSYYIYGQNGSGKSVLSMAILVAVQRKWYELLTSKKEFRDRAKREHIFIDGDFKPYFPRDLMGSDRTEGKELIMAISDCIDVDNLVTAETSDKQARYPDQIVDGISFSLWAAASTSMSFSGAQSVNAYLIREVERFSHQRTAALTAIILDEPETSRDRKQSRHLGAEIANIRRRVGENAIAIVPTHSESIFRDSTALRIDLDHPEKGIHLPEDDVVVESISLDGLTTEQLLLLAKRIAKMIE